MSDERVSDGILERILAMPCTCQKAGYCDHCSMCELFGSSIARECQQHRQRERELREALSYLAYRRNCQGLDGIACGCLDALLEKYPWCDSEVMSEITFSCLSARPQFGIFQSSTCAARAARNKERERCAAIAEKRGVAWVAEEMRKSL